MGLKTPEVNGARQELPCLESPEVNGARQDVAAVKKFISGAWQEIWSNALYFLKEGELRNGATLGAYGVQGSGAVYGSTPNSNDDILLIRFQLTPDMVGKTLYIRAGSNVTVRDPSGGYGYLILYYPLGGSAGSYRACTTSVDGLLAFDITADYIAAEGLHGVGIGNTSSYTEYHIHDIFVK